MLRIAVSFTS